MLVDPETLRAIASQVDAASGAIRSADVRHEASTAANGLPSSTTQWAMRLVGEHVTQQVTKIAKSLQQGVGVRGAGDKYEVEDGALADTFDGLF